jgi:ComF family protein
VQYTARSWGMIEHMSTFLQNIRFFFLPPSPETLYISRLSVDALFPHVRLTHTKDFDAFLPYRTALITLLVQHAKFHNNTQASTLLGTALASYVAEELGEKRSFNTYEAPVLVPMPLHKTREKERGFNQSARIARALLTELDDTSITLSPHILIRQKHTEAQSCQGSKTDRLRNVRDAFFVPTPEHVKGKEIILFDDVVTTGATLKSAKQTLRRAGARSVWCVAVAH